MTKLPAGLIYVCIMLAAGPEVARAKGVEWHDLVEAADTFNVRKRDLVLILGVERGSVGVCGLNKNQSLDCGPAQINTTHGKRLAEIFGTEPTDAMRAVRDRPRLNVFTAAWLLKKATMSADGDHCLGMLLYHSSKKKFQKVYWELLAREARRLGVEYECPMPSDNNGSTE